MLRRAELFSFGMMPTNGRRIEQYLRAAQGEQTGRFWIPLIPADADAQLCKVSFRDGKAEVAWREVELLIVQRVIRDMHFSITAYHTTVDIEGDRRVVIQPLSAAFEDRARDNDFMFGCCRGESLAGRSGNFLGQVKQPMIFGLAWILSVEHFLQTNNLPAALGRASDPFDRFVDVGLLVLRAAHLHQGQLNHA